MPGPFSVETPTPGIPTGLSTIRFAPNSPGCGGGGGGGGVEWCLAYDSVSFVSYPASYRHSCIIHHTTVPRTRKAQEKAMNAGGVWFRVVGAVYY